MCKLVAAADKLSTLIVLLGAHADVTVGRNLKLLEGGHSQQGRHVDGNLHSRHAAEDCALRDSGKVGSTARQLRRSTVVANRIAKAADAQHTVGELNHGINPILGHSEGDCLCSGCRGHLILVGLAIRHSDALGGLLVSQEAAEIVDAGQLACGMIESGILHGDLVARLHHSDDLVIHGNVAVAGFGSHHLIDTLSSIIGQTDDVAALDKM